MRILLATLGIASVVASGSLAGAAVAAAPVQHPRMYYTAPPSMYYTAHPRMYYTVHPSGHLAIAKAGPRMYYT